MDYGIRKVLKEKKVKDKKIEMVELFGTNLYAILVFNSDGDLIDSECNCSFEKVNRARKLTNKNFKKKIKILQKCDNLN